MNIFIYFRDILFKDIENIYSKVLVSDDIKIEFPKNSEYGDISSNVAIIIAKKLKINPKNVAEKLLPQICQNQYILEGSIAKVGLLNFRLKKEFWHLFLKKLINNNGDYPKINIGNNEAVNIEFVSANPTGPLHLGHAKGAIFGDVIANILSKCGFKVTKEFYINDAGNQINNLANSLETRFRQLSEEKKELDKNCYPGEYIIELAKILETQHNDTVNKLSDQEKKVFFKNFATKEILKIIKKDLKQLKVHHDKSVSEKSLIEQNKVKYCINFLKNKNLLYKGVLDKPKGEKNNEWKLEQQTLFKSTNFGDDIDRAIIKSNGEYTYFASDIAYHFDKIGRGFSNMILLLGADHIGYKKRLESSVNALSGGNAKLTIKICQLVKLSKDGRQVKMSKRSGNFISLAEVLDDIGSDSLRFAILSKSADTVLEIDIEKLKEQTKDNPIFYVQYASARVNSILRKAEDLGLYINDIITKDIDLSYLDSKYDLELIKVLALYPKILISCLSTLDPHKISYYLYDLACTFHQIWSKNTKKQNIKFIIKDDIKLTKSRIYLVYAVKNVLISGLKILGIKAIQKI